MLARLQLLVGHLDQQLHLAADRQVDADYASLGVVLDASGNWTGSGGAWRQSDVGSWVKYVRIAGRLAGIAFQVSSTPPPPPGSGLFGPYENATGGPYYGGRGTVFADATGDRRADAIVVNDDTVTVRRSH